MSLENVKVGDELVIHDRNRGTGFATVSAVARKYLTAGGDRYDIATGRIHDNYGHAVAYTPEQWARIVANAELAAAVRKVRDARPADSLTADALRSIAAELDAIALRLTLGAT